MPLGIYYATPLEAIAGSGFTDDANEANFIILERKLPSAAEADGVRVIWMGVGGTDPDGSQFEKYIYNPTDGWVFEAVATDTTRSAVALIATAIPDPTISLTLTNAERTAFLTEMDL